MCATVLYLAVLPRIRYKFHGVHRGDMVEPYMNKPELLPTTPMADNAATCRQEKVT
jgi:hypothetical protein